MSAQRTHPLWLCLVVLQYGGLLWALLPIRDRALSWEGHLMGMTIGCVLGAYDGRAGAVPLGEDAPPPASQTTVKSKDVAEKTGLMAKEEDSEDV